MFGMYVSYKEDRNMAANTCYSLTQLIIIMNRHLITSDARKPKLKDKNARIVTSRT